MQFPLFDAGLAAHLHEDGAPPSPPGNIVHVMLKPSGDLAERISKLGGNDRNRGADLLHTTIQPIGDRRWITDADIEATGRALSQLRYPPFLMMFDRMEGGESMALRGGDLGNPAAQDFRLAVLDMLSSHFRRLPAYHFHPHMTLDHRGGRPGRLLDQPIAWLIEEFMLVESAHGGTHHIEWGRWRLRGD
ncbi:MAG: hypothetical protein QM690_01840 [Sphingobium sp.]